VRLRRAFLQASINCLVAAPPGRLTEMGGFFGTESVRMIGVGLVISASIGQLTPNGNWVQPCHAVMRAPEASKAAGPSDRLIVRAQPQLTIRSQEAALQHTGDSLCDRSVPAGRQADPAVSRRPVRLVGSHRATLSRAGIA
jgi:hypothetical protein